MKATPDDWIVEGIEGEYYPVKPSVFAAKYEPLPRLPRVLVRPTPDGEGAISQGE